MEDLSIAATKYTPEILLKAEEGTITITGKSYPENTFEFYKPVMEWIEQYFGKEGNRSTTINIELIYFNSSSSKLFYDLFDLVQESSSGHDIIINWIYDEENESALEAGEDFQEDFEDLTFNLREK